MSLRHTVAATDLDALFGQTEAEIAAANTAGVNDAVQGLKAELREITRAAGLGNRLAGTWQGRTYPSRGDSLDPAGYIWSKAPVLADAYGRGATILPLDGRYYLAIPTRNVPRKGRGLMTPLDVETYYNQDLVLRRNGRGNILAFVDVAFGRYSRSQGAAYGKRKLRRPGKPKLVLMFTLVRQVRVRKRMDPDAAYGRWADRVPDLIAGRYAGASNGPPVGLVRLGSRS